MTSEETTLLSPITFRTHQSHRVSEMAGGLIGSEILKIAADIRAMTAAGKQICNLTVGDFNSKYFPIPDSLKESIHAAYEKGETNYPPSDGIPQLRQAVQGFYERELGLSYPVESILVTGGARPAIYGTYRAIVEDGDHVLFPVPSWNNNHYCHLTGAIGIPVVCTEATDFLPTRELLQPHVKHARLLSLCSPLNPAGTTFSREALESICDMVLEENLRRQAKGDRPLFVMYDQVYWMLTFGGTEHFNPVTIRPEMAEYTIFIDGISKAFAATGLRVGWTVGPPDVISRMSSIVGHVGAWAPRPEQVASAELLNDPAAILSYQASMKKDVEQRLDLLFEGVNRLKSDGYSVDAISPMGAIYLTVQFNLIGRTTPSGKLDTNEDIRKYLLEEAALAVVPFQAFGSSENTGWFRLSVGAVSIEEINAMFPRLKAAIDRLQ